MDNEFENIIPWNGANDTGRDVRLKWQRNFERIKANFEEVLALIGKIDIEELAQYFLRKDQSDSTNYLQKFLGGLEIGEFNKGTSGVGVYQDEKGNWHIESDYLDVRLKFTANSVEIQKAYHIGGQQIKSAASMKCIRVEELEEVYRCYMNTVDDDGNQVTNDFHVNDQAYVNTFNLVKHTDGKVGNHFLWRLVVAVGSDYIDLSKTICAEQSDAPMANDDIVLLGYQGSDVPSRQVAVIDAGAGEGAPYYRQFVGINSFSLPAPETQLKPGDNELSGRFHIGQGSTGWENMDGLPEEIQAAADLAQQAQADINNAAVGSVNLLLNSGFTGNYETEDMDADKQLDADTELYSKALMNWSGMATVQEDAESGSGRSAVVGSLSQSVTLIPNESYVISYKAKGTQLAVSCGDYSVAQPLTSEYVRYTHRFTFTGAGVFLVSGTATVCDLQLERGTIATDWKPSIFDNDKTNAKFQTIQHIYNAIKDGSVDAVGGLILATMIMVGNYKDDVLQKVTAGMSGIYNDDDDVFTWGGGTLEQAIYTVMKYKENPQYVPTEDELLGMAKAVITHGGRAILNDVVVRGYIYALGGFFKGVIDQANGFNRMNEDGSVSFAGGKITWGPDGNPIVQGRVTTALDGTRIVIDPATNSLAMYNQEEKEVCKISFVEEDFNGSKNYYPYIRLNKYSGDTMTGECMLNSGGFYNGMMISGEDKFEFFLDPRNGIRFLKNNEEVKTYPAS